VGLSSGQRSWESRPVELRRRHRMMSALLRYLGRNNPASGEDLDAASGRGGGMADDPAVRELMQRKGVGYIQVNGACRLFLPEISVAPATMIG